MVVYIFFVNNFVIYFPIDTKTNALSLTVNGPTMIVQNGLTVIELIAQWNECVHLKLRLFTRIAVVTLRATAIV